MMIPTIFFLGLNPAENLAFQIVQTGLDYLFVFFLLYFVLRKINPRAYDRRKVLITALAIEGVHVVSFFMWYFFAFYAIGGIVIELFFLLLVPYFVIYLLYTPSSENFEKDSKQQGDQPDRQESYVSTGKSWVVHALSVPPALLLSTVITSLVFTLLGIHHIFIFS